MMEMNEVFIPSLPRVESIAITDHNRGSSRNQADDLASMRRQLAAAVGVSCPAWLQSNRDDIVQNAMMAILRQQEKKRGEQEKNPSQRQFSPSYLKKAAFTATIDEIRRRRSRGEVPLEPEGEIEPILVEVSASPERQAISNQLASGVRTCLARLPPPRKMAVTLHLLGYKVPQMAKKMGWTRKQAENLVYRGMRDLREHLQAEGITP